MKDLQETLKGLKARKADQDQDIQFHANLSEELQDEITAIEAQIADSEVTYSIGDRFVDHEDNVKAMLVMVGQFKVCMIDLTGGNRYIDPVKVVDGSKIKDEELRSMCTFNNFTRYWDARKQCKC